MAPYSTYPSTLNCGAACPINGLWFADLEGLVLDYECGTLIEFTYSGELSSFARPKLRLTLAIGTSIIAPYCDFAEGNTPEPSGYPTGEGTPTLVVPPAVLGELGDSTGVDLTVTYVFPAPS